MGLLQPCYATGVGDTVLDAVIFPVP